MKSIRTTRIHQVAAAAIVAVFAGAAHAEPAVLTDNAGMTVYTFDKDGKDRSACYGDCAAAWPPVAVDSMPTGADFHAISRDDGADQAVYDGKPLYRFAGDRKPGDVTGDNVQNVWHVVKRGGSQATVNPARSSNSPGNTSGYNYY